MQLISVSALTYASKSEIRYLRTKLGRTKKGTKCSGGAEYDADAVT